MHSGEKLGGGKIYENFWKLGKKHTLVIFSNLKIVAEGKFCLTVWPIRFFVLAII